MIMYLFLLMFLFIFLEISFFVHESSFYLDAYKIVTYHLHVPAKIYWGVSYYISVQLLIHLAYLFLIWSIATQAGKLLNLTRSQVEKLGITLWVMGIITILLANQYFYPNSKFALLVGIIVPLALTKILLPFLMGMLSIAASLAVSSLLIYQRRLLLISISAVLGLTTAAYYYSSLPITSAATSTKPNIIIIGIDAVRPDFLGFFGHGNGTPHLDQFLNQAAVFSEALTPLARTYPAWVSILTGQYPKHNGARFDLAPSLHYDLHETLPAILQRNGYETLYATDETRFSNIDQRFGFDQVITPPIGFNDFLLGNLNDFPLSNLLVNTFLGRYLFPYSYGNRAAYITYEPTTFLILVQTALDKPHTKPLFLSIHFCLSHLPYIWARQPSDDTPVENYQHGLHEVDKQVYSFLQRLKQNHLLEHSVVILLSDHGEALELAGDRITEADLFISKTNHSIPHFYPPGMDEEQVNQSAGHGTDVLGLTQYHSLLAIRFFGVKTQSATVVPGRVTLLDIKPTVLNLLNLTSKHDDGKSLLDYVSGKRLVVNAQPDFFTETDFTPAAIRSVNPEMRKVLFEGVDYIQIDPATTRLSIRPSMAKLILSSKQYADFYGSWALALYPQNPRWMMPVLVNLQSGQWTTDLHSTFAQQTPAQHMLRALKRFYGEDITNIR